MRAVTCEHKLETLHWHWFVRCEGCGRWRLYKKGEVFFKMTMRYLDLRPIDKHGNRPPLIKAKMSADTFEKTYAEKSGMTIEQLREYDRVVLPCDCGDDGCMGWQMAHLPKEARNMSVCSDEFHALEKRHGEALCLVCRESLIGENDDKV